VQGDQALCVAEQKLGRGSGDAAAAERREQRMPGLFGQTLHP